MDCFSYMLEYLVENCHYDNGEDEARAYADLKAAQPKRYKGRCGSKKTKMSLDDYQRWAGNLAEHHNWAALGTDLEEAREAWLHGENARENKVEIILSNLTQTAALLTRQIIDLGAAIEARKKGNANG